MLSSHLLDDIERIADRILIMVNGRIAVDCPLESLVDRVSSCTVELDEAAIGGSLVAFGLGLAQFMLDQRSSARAFLVHRSLTPSQLFRGKLLVGLGIYALGVGGPLMLLSAPSPTANVPIGWERRFIPDDYQYCHRGRNRWHIRPKGYAELNFQWNPTYLGQRSGQNYFQMNNGFVHSYGLSFQGWRLDHVIGANGMTENGRYPSEPFSGRVRQIIDYENHASGSLPEMR